LRIRFSEEGKSTLHSLHIAIQRKVKEALKRLANGEVKGKALTAQLTGFWTLIVDNHRIIYQNKSQEIIVNRVGHRSTVYSSVLTNKMLEE